MNIKERLSEDLKNSMKQGNKFRLGVIRMLLSEIKYAQAAENIHQELAPEAMLKTVQSYQKKLQKAYNEYPAGEQKETLGKELQIVEEFLPKAPSTADIQAAIAKVLAAHPAGTGFAVLMKDTMTALGPGATGGEVSRLLKEATTASKPS